MSWISTNNLRRFADNLFHGKLSFSGDVTHNGAVEFNSGIKVNTVKAEFTAPVSFTGTATYKNNEIATKADITDSNIINLTDTFYPIGTVYISADKTKTKADFPFMTHGTWEEVPANLCLQTGNASEAGTQRSAGLPNITGTVITKAAWSNGGSYGAFYDHVISAKWVGGEASQTMNEYSTFDASRSNPIYGGSYTVQPPAYMVRAWVRTA